MLFARSVGIASTRHPWLPVVPTLPTLRDAMEQQDPATIADAFTAILSNLIDLLKRLIGDGLVDRLLNELWPSVFVQEAKDIP
jgi:hypothetical protein